MSVKEPKIVLTLMVRDEADIIAAMVEHHLAQGVDLIIATDNGSVDGTREILADYAATGRVELHDYLAHDKNQSQVVSAMASRAATEHGATWVINADADEFFMAVDRSLTLRDVLRRIPTGIGAFEVPVVNMTGDPAREGPALSRHVMRDIRQEATLMETVALHAHPTANVVHVGRADVRVQQGNHNVDIARMGQPDPAYSLEALHFPWRSYAQYSTKIMNTGRSYDANPTLNPSPRHHGMRDYRFWKAGVLEPIYLVRHPNDADSGGFVRDESLVSSLRAVLDDGDAARPDLLRPVLDDDWTGYSSAERKAAEEVARIVIPLEIEHLATSSLWRDLYRTESAQRRRALEERDASVDELRRLRARPEVRARALVGCLLRAPCTMLRRVIKARRA